MEANIENELVNIKNDYIAKMKELKFQALKKKTLILIENDKCYSRNTQELPKELQNDFDIALAIVKKDSQQLQWHIKQWNNNKEIVLIAVNEYGANLQFASKELQNDKEVVLTAIKTKQPMSCWVALKFASEELRNDREVVLAVLERQLYWQVFHPTEFLGFVGAKLGKELLMLAIEYLKKIDN